MKITLSKINGTNADLDYDALKESIIKKLGENCKEAEVIILNNFPVSVTAQASVDFILLLNIPKRDRSWYRVKTADDRHYIKNQIIAVTIVNEYSNSNICTNGGLIEIDGAYVDFEDNTNKIKWGLTNYLSSNCGLDRRYITVHPITWVKNSRTSYTSSSILIDKEFTYDKVEEVIKLNHYFKWPGYRQWYDSDELFEIQIMQIFEQASKDSVDGYITKKKIDRIQGKLDNASIKAYENIGEKLVEVNGKAGTGKSSDILKWMLRLSVEGRKGLFLTYNHVLVYDISSQIQSFTNRLSQDDRQTKQPTTTYTIHGYFYRVAKKLGVLLLLTEKRIKELTIKLDSRWVQIEAYFNTVRTSENGISLAKLLMYVQSKWNIDEGTKREAILFIQRLESLRSLPNQEETAEQFRIYRNDKVDKLGNLESSNVFLKDYHKVLERILQVASNLDSFLSDLDVVSKYDLLENVMRLEEDILEKDGSGKINLQKLKTRYRKSLGGFRAGRIAYIDEAQDCHPLERDILYSIFGSNNIVIANGGKEQLIRYSQLCDWQISRNQIIECHKYQKRRKSYRMKPAIASLANHIATWYEIDLDIELIDTEDHGNILIDFSRSNDKYIESVKKLKTIGERQGCTNYESLLLLTSAESNSKKKFAIEEETSVSVNQYDNIVKDAGKSKNEWALISEAQSKIGDMLFWNTTGNVDKRSLSPPGSLSVRSIYYESCRGIEAWSVMCFNLDEFFEQKTLEKDADNYLLESLFDQLTPDKRRAMYAATWVLMAITRSMENCYIQIQDPKSSLAKAILSFQEQYPQYVIALK
ncbi:hypothetical protein D9V96_019540 [Zobellia laminariae]|uniref:hypothetical protein n=1 Tax=Zobellia laminariae TaxID=248906 RepID=UPI0012D90E78|nr:hypothetical protein [Zobellia laminariae]